MNIGPLLNIGVVDASPTNGEIDDWYGVLIMSSKSADPGEKMKHENNFLGRISTSVDNLHFVILNNIIVSIAMKKEGKIIICYTNIKT